MSKRGLELISEQFTITGHRRGAEITIHDCSLYDILQYYGEEAVLDEIGKNKAKEYFDLQEKE